MKYLKINAISNAQSDYIARRCQRCEDSEWLCEAILLKKQPCLHPDGGARKNYPSTPFSTNSNLTFIL